ncbi:hypothetical protein BC629DRAFT_1720621 [Irpex lacteus]|nr:hypothetical protein BC629DRAFT_1720621 [Irpex lacteus]
MREELWHMFETSFTHCRNTYELEMAKISYVVRVFECLSSSMHALTSTGWQLRMLYLYETAQWLVINTITSARWGLPDSKDSSNSNLKVRDLVDSLWEEVRVLHSTVESAIQWSLLLYTGIDDGLQYTVVLQAAQCNSAVTRVTANEYTSPKPPVLLKEAKPSASVSLPLPPTRPTTTSLSLPPSTQ